MPQNLCATVLLQVRQQFPPFHTGLWFSLCLCAFVVRLPRPTHVFLICSVNSVISVISVLKIRPIPDLNTEDTESAEAEDGNLKLET